MGMWVGIGRKARRSYGFDEVSLVPGKLTINPADVDTSCEIGGIKFRPTISYILYPEFQNCRVGS